MMHASTPPPGTPPPPWGTPNDVLSAFAVELAPDVPEKPTSWVGALSSHSAAARSEDCIASTDTLQIHLDGISVLQNE